jgi:dTDP-4-amino-4,6-dideoxygalactose transaminase
MFDKPFELVSPLLPEVDRLLPDLREALASKWLTHDGPFVRRLELAMSEVLDAVHVAAVASGTAGLMVGIRALGWRGEVIIPSFGFAGTAHAITWAGCTPVLADVDRETFTLDPASVERMATPATVGLLPVDAFGVRANLEALRRAGGDRPQLVDAAHALGTRPSGRPTAAVYSLHPTKTIVAGEGGLVATGDGGLADRVRRLRNFGFAEGQNAFDIGLNAKLPELSAILAYHQIELLPETIAGRERWDSAYREVLAGVPGLRFQTLPRGGGVNYQYTPIVVDARQFGRTRDQVADELRHRNVVTRPYFSPPIHLMDAYRGKLRTDDLRWTEELSQSVLCLPVHPGEAPELAGDIAGLISSLRR